MNTLNYWLGKLQRLQLFGHGNKELVIRTTTGAVELTVVNVVERDGVVYIEVE